MIKIECSAKKTEGYSFSIETIRHIAKVYEMSIDEREMQVFGDGVNCQCFTFSSDSNEVSQLSWCLDCLVERLQPSNIIVAADLCRTLYKESK